MYTAVIEVPYGSECTFAAGSAPQEHRYRQMPILENHAKALQERLPDSSAEQRICNSIGLGSFAAVQ